MEDEGIISLYWQRSDQAITETQTKYGRLLRSISFGILKSHEDAEECENDTYLRTWNVIPPQRPAVFSAFLSKIVRNLSLDRYDSLHAGKRGNGEVPALLDELAECLPDEEENNPAAGIEQQELTRLINDYLGTLSEDTRTLFLRRYWFGDSIQDIVKETGSGTSKVKMRLLRARKGLKEVLEQSGYGN